MAHKEHITGAWSIITNLKMLKCSGRVLIDGDLIVMWLWHKSTVTLTTNLTNYKMKSDKITISPNLMAHKENITQPDR